MWLKPGGGTGGRTKALGAWLGRGLALEAGLGGEAAVCGCVQGVGPGLRGGAEARGRGRRLDCQGLGCLPAHRARSQVLGLCGAAYRPTEEIDLRSVGWGNIFQLPFKHVRDFRLRHLVPFFIYSGFEVLFACTGLALVSTACVELAEKNTGGPLRFEF